LFTFMSFRSAAARLVAAMVLVTIACVPTMARAHDRLENQRTPAQEHSRFRWTNSCASVPQKHTTVVVATPADGPTRTILPFPPRLSAAAASTDAPLPDLLRIRSPYGFRAPPARLL
jgi:CelD/BcsL family acetyltransferase involved in cellulose biosynthesis